MGDVAEFTITLVAALVAIVFAVFFISAKYRHWAQKRQFREHFRSKGSDTTRSPE